MELRVRGGVGGSDQPMEIAMSERGREQGGLEQSTGGDARSAGGREERAWLGLQFVCARAYARAVKDRDGRGYTGRCPKCARVVKFAIGPGGTSDRFFRVDCGR